MTCAGNDAPDAVAATEIRNFVQASVVSPTQVGDPRFEAPKRGVRWHTNGP
jgi:hypothetical protein